MPTARFERKIADPNDLRVDPYPSAHAAGPGGGHVWQLINPTDVIPATVGGNRHGAFATNEFPFLAIDESLRP
jgi:hypothetical protein